MRGRQIALLGSMLLLAGALAGCVGDSTDSDDSDDGVVATGQSQLLAGQPAPPPGGDPKAGGGDQNAAEDTAPDITGAKQSDPEPSPWVPGQGDMSGSSDDDGMEPEPSPWHDSHAGEIRIH
jgi:hypothetical protein